MFARLCQPCPDLDPHAEYPVDEYRLPRLRGSAAKVIAYFSSSLQLRVMRCVLGAAKIQIQIQNILVTQVKPPRVPRWQAAKCYVSPPPRTRQSLANVFSRGSASPGRHETRTLPEGRIGTRRCDTENDAAGAARMYTCRHNSAPVQIQIQIQIQNILVTQVSIAGGCGLRQGLADAFSRGSAAYDIAKTHTAPAGCHRVTPPRYRDRCEKHSAHSSTNMVPVCVCVICLFRTFTALLAFLCVACALCLQNRGCGHVPNALRASRGLRLTPKPKPQHYYPASPRTGPESQS